ncbi:MULTISPECIES: YbaL family putative K(+) efflux transporter [Sphingobium]|jgi:CPA2 family monovalent cation:H+ antiporter-2|uniref:Kef family K(+) transporter n=2 Tax=Sphingobium fuliginis (strain ATCC 27551) TaxID=336203 RepID=A0A292ZI36_SPHSA|nr:MULTISPECIES: YbaL family putative K(+) efflux transporter [Sphingobium]OAP29232.1 cation:proton antiport protein [Sphingobium sp. 20006FA]AJR24669.1 cation:proton antiport protein [Sphingobium sp. YBL2]KXU29255.1 cation:proton antiport protein [Sphingobium sp. AM]KYC29686.1 cation:proton antiport protein [Sphingobium sp. 22B]PNQ03746.1 cation:proton antiport protein [Sphingobium sp. SA916]
MPHHTPLIGTIVAGLVVAFVMGAIAHRLKLSPLVGYLIAGIMVGPFTPGFVANASLANELAEIGVILLMFGVGLHFSLRDLLSVKNIAVPGALGQIAVATLMGMGLAHVMGWPLLGGLVFGLALSVASTVVLLRALQGADLVETRRGRIAVGWLIVEDLVMVLALVLLPALAGVMNNADAAGGANAGALLAPLLGTLLKVAGFVALMLVVGRRVIPWALHWVVHSGSRELFRLAVLAIALGVAFGAAVAFDVSFALGAFFAGMILGETPLSRRATEETLPLRDAFAVLFFVSVGMLFNPAVLVEQPLPLLATVAIIIVGKSIAAFAIVRAFGHPGDTALTIAASLAQIGEFSFILASLGTGLGVLPAEARDLILAGAIVSIFLNPLIFSLIVRGHKQEEVEEEAQAQKAKAKPRIGHVILVGYGRVGKLIADRLAEKGAHFVVIEADSDRAEEAEEAGLTVVRGSALEDRHLRAAGINEARRLLIAVPEGFEGGAIHEHARHLNPHLQVIARAHSDAEVRHLEGLGVPHVVMGERELAARMLSLCGAG